MTVRQCRVHTLEKGFLKIFNISNPIIDATAWCYWTTTNEISPISATGTSSVANQGNPISVPVPYQQLTPERVVPPILKPLGTQNMTSHVLSLSVDQPPPLPPRRPYNPLNKPRDLSTGELAPVLQAADAPTLPPRDTTAPPVPPRREQTQQTLPRAHSMTIQRQSPVVTSTTLPRRNSERDHVTLNVNGERGGSDTPELPPKTYRVTHARKQSS